MWNGWSQVTEPVAAELASGTAVGCTWTEPGRTATRLRVPAARTHLGAGVSAEDVPENEESEKNNNNNIKT